MVNIKLFGIIDPPFFQDEVMLERVDRKKVERMIELRKQASHTYSLGLAAYSKGDDLEIVDQYVYRYIDLNNEASRLEEEIRLQFRECIDRELSCEESD